MLLLIIGFSIWQHLKEEMKLSYLAQELISTDRLSPQAWYGVVLLHCALDDVVAHQWLFLLMVDRSGNILMSIAV